MSNHYSTERSHEGSDHEPYRFTLEDGKVVRVEEFDDGRWETETIDADERYVLDGQDILKTEWESGYQETTRYTDANGDGLYLEVSETRTSTADGSPGAPVPDSGRSLDGYTFTITGGQVTGVTEYEHGVARVERIDSNESYALQGTDVIKTEWEHGGQEITRYTDANGDGLYVESSEQWIATTPGTTAGTPTSGSVLQSRGGDGDDLVTVRSTKAPAVGGQGADTFYVRDWGHVVIEDFDRSQGDRIAFDSGQGVDSAQQLLARITDLRWQGDDLLVSLGDQASVTLVGIRPHGIALSDVDTLS